MHSIGPQEAGDWILAYELVLMEGSVRDCENGRDLECLTLHEQHAAPGGISLWHWSGMLAAQHTRLVLLLAPTLTIQLVSAVLAYARWTPCLTSAGIYLHEQMSWTA